PMPPGDDGKKRALQSAHGKRSGFGSTCAAYDVIFQTHASLCEGERGGSSIVRMTRIRHSITMPGIACAVLARSLLAPCFGAWSVRRARLWTGPGAFVLASRLAPCYGRCVDQASRLNTETTNHNKGD